MFRVSVGRTESHCPTAMNKSSPSLNESVEVVGEEKLTTGLRG